MEKIANCEKYLSIVLEENGGSVIRDSFGDIVEGENNVTGVRAVYPASQAAFRKRVDFYMQDRTGHSMELQADEETGLICEFTLPVEVCVGGVTSMVFVAYEDDSAQTAQLIKWLPVHLSVKHIPISYREASSGNPDILVSSYEYAREALEKSRAAEGTVAEIGARADATLNKFNAADIPAQIELTPDNPSVSVDFSGKDLKFDFRLPVGKPFRIQKVYSSVAAMEADASGEVAAGDFVVINTENVDMEENARLYLRTETGFSFLTDLSGAQGIQGPQGERGERGEKGDTGELPPGWKDDNAISPDSVWSSAKINEYTVYSRGNGDDHIYLQEIVDRIETGTRARIVLKGKLTFSGGNFAGTAALPNGADSAIVRYYVRIDKPNIVIDGSDAEIVFTGSAYNDHIALLYLGNSATGCVLSGIRFTAEANGAFYCVLNSGQRVTVSGCDLNVNANTANTVRPIANMGSNLEYSPDANLMAGSEFSVKNSRISVTYRSSRSSGIYCGVWNTANSASVSDTYVFVSVAGSQSTNVYGIWNSGHYFRMNNANVKANGAYPAGSSSYQPLCYGFYNRGNYAVASGCNIVAEQCSSATALYTSGSYGTYTGNKILATHCLTGVGVSLAAVCNVVTGNHIASTSPSHQLVKVDSSESVVSGNCLQSSGYRNNVNSYGQTVYNYRGTGVYMGNGSLTNCQCQGNYFTGYTEYGACVTNSNYNAHIDLAFNIFSSGNRPRYDCYCTAASGSKVYAVGNHGNNSNYLVGCKTTF